MIEDISYGGKKHKKTKHKKTNHKKKHKQTKHHTGKHCSPFKKNLTYSCLSHKALHNIVKAINKVNGITINYKGVSDEELYQEVCNVMENNFNCKTEACWLNIRKIMKNLSKKDVEHFKSHFRPHMPKEIVDDYTEWISNFDIEAVLKQYQEDLPYFHFYGAIPRDFSDCSVSDLCKIDIGKHLDRGEHKLGMVFNTDESDKPGKHWLSMFIDLNGSNLDGQPGIYHFDSFGSKPLKEMKDLIQKVEEQGKQRNMDFVVTNNDRSFQNNSYSCGFYSMHFMEYMLRGLPFQRYLKSGLTDKKMVDYQKHCYLHPEEIKY